MALAAAALVTGLLLTPAQAKTVTWTGASKTGSDWSLSGNWNGGVPVNGDALVFAAGAGQLGNNNNLGSASFSSVTFAEGAGAYSLGQNRFTSTGAITNNSTSLQTLRAGVTVGGSQAWTGGTGGLAFQGIDFGSGSTTFAVAGSGLISSRGDITNATSAQQKLQMLLSVDTDQTWSTGSKGLNASSLTGSGNVTLKNAALIIGGANSAQSTYSGSFNGGLSGVIYNGSAKTAQTLTGSGSTLNSLHALNGMLTLSTGSMTLNSTTDSLLVSRGRLLVNKGFKLDARVGNAGQTLAANIDSNPSDGAGGSAVMQIAGVGTEFHSGGYFSVGQSNQGRLDVIEGASMINDGQLVIGRYGSGTGELHVESGARLTTNELGVGILQDMRGEKRQSIGTVTITGAGSVLNVATQLGIGGLKKDPGRYYGKGSVLISDQATVNAGSVSFYNSYSSLTIDRGSLSTPVLSSEEDGVGNIKLTNPTGGVALNLDTSRGNSSYSGSISGTGGISKTGAKTQSLWGWNTFTGDVLVTAGKLEMGSGAASSYRATGSTAIIQIHFADLGTSTVQADAGGVVDYWWTRSTAACSAVTACMTCPRSRC